MPKSIAYYIYVIHCRDMRRCGLLEIETLWEMPRETLWETLWDANADADQMVAHAADVIVDGSIEYGGWFN